MRSLSPRRTRNVGPGNVPFYSRVVNNSPPESVTVDHVSRSTVSSVPLTDDTERGVGSEVAEAE